MTRASRPGMIALLTAAMLVATELINAHPGRAQRRAGENDAIVVTARSLRITVPPPFALPDPRGGGAVGHYVWRFDIPEPDPFTLVLTADTAMRKTSLDDIVRASTLRLCPEPAPASVRACTTTLEARATLSRGNVSIVVTDTAFLARVRRERRLAYLRSTLMPRGRVSSAEQLFVYADDR